MRQSNGTLMLVLTVCMILFLADATTSTVPFAPPFLSMMKTNGRGAGGYRRGEASFALVRLRGGDEGGQTDVEPSGEVTDVVMTNSELEESANVESSVAAVADAVAAAQPSKWSNLQSRLLPAILMLGGVAAITHYAKEEGLIGLTLLLQGGMYHEVTQVIGGHFAHPFSIWWWFLTASVAANGPRLVPWATVEVSTVSYTMTALSLVTGILSLNQKGGGVDEFREWLRQAAVSLLAIVLVVFPSSFWISTLEEFGMEFMLYSVALVILNDTMAYVFGMTVGKHPLLPSISPKKTWEGFIGAALSTVAVAWYWLPNKQDALYLAVFASLIAPFGGYVASVVKRAYSVKDFGSLIPGHGGLVDRLDCQLVMAPFVYLYLTLSRNDGSNGFAKLLSKVTAKK